MCPHRYYTLIRESKAPPYLRLRMVQEAKRLGVKPAATLFASTPNLQNRLQRPACHR